MLVVDCNGLHVLHPPNLAPIDFFPFGKIANWASFENEFGVVVGSLMNPTRFVFYTREVRLEPRSAVITPPHSHHVHAHF